MSDNNETKVTWRMSILGNFIKPEIQEAIKEKTDELGVSGVSRLEIILEGKKALVTEVVCCLLENHLSGVVHFEGDMKPFANDFKGREFRIT